MAGKPHSPRRIEIDGETLISDRDFCLEFLAGCSRRTAARYDLAGLPFTFIRGAKYRPVLAGQEWLKSRIVRRNG